MARSLLDAADAGRTLETEKQAAMEFLAGMDSGFVRDWLEPWVRTFLERSEDRLDIVSNDRELYQLRGGRRAVRELWSFLTTTAEEARKTVLEDDNEEDDDV